LKVFFKKFLFIFFEKLKWFFVTNFLFLSQILFKFLSVTFFGGDCEWKWIPWRHAFWLRDGTAHVRVGDRSLKIDRLLATVRAPANLHPPLAPVYMLPLRNLIYSCTAMSRLKIYALCASLLELGMKT
jgi:hypothetical protein